MANVLVMGASRGIGLETVKQSLKAGHKVRAMARSASSIPIRHANLETFAGDALDPSAVRKSLEGVDTVIQALGVAAGPDMLLKPVRLFSEATWILVSAMEEVGVKRLICLTGFGAGDSRNRGNILYNMAFNLFLGRAYDDKDIQERIIRESQVDWVIARPGILTNGPKTERYCVLVDPRQWRCGFISRADVADFLVKQIDSDEYLGKTPVLQG
jgi:putative NADH-flavin reductase